MYLVKSTFGVSGFAPQERIADIINNEAKNMIWYRDNKHPEIASWILEYLGTYNFFVYGMPKPTRSLLHFMIRVLNSDYCSELGFTKYYDKATNKFSKNYIKDELEQIESAARKIYPSFSINTSAIEFKDNIAFAYSLLNQIKQLNYNTESA